MVILPTELTVSLSESEKTLDGAQFVDFIISLLGKPPISKINAVFLKPACIAALNYQILYKNIEFNNTPVNTLWGNAHLGAILSICSSNKKLFHLYIKEWGGFTLQNVNFRFKIMNEDFFNQGVLENNLTSLKIVYS